jgi:hypothetical protein
MFVSYAVFNLLVLERWWASVDRNWCAQCGSNSPYVMPLCFDATKSSCLSWCSPKDKPQESLRARSHEVDIPRRNRTRDLICVDICDFFFFSGFHGGVVKMVVVFGFLGAFAYSRKTPISFVMSVRPSVRIISWATTGRVSVTSYIGGFL